MLLLLMVALMVSKSVTDVSQKSDEGNKMLLYIFLKKGKKACKQKLFFFDDG
jgi:hypothetical protein